MAKYFVGVRQPYAIIFKSEKTPTTEEHPVNVKFCWGPYTRKLKAIEVAMYQNYRIEPGVYTWDGQHNSDLG